MVWLVGFVCFLQNKKSIANNQMPQGPGYFEMPGKGRRYSDGKGGIFHNHSGPALNQLGNLDPRKAVNAYMDANPLVTDPVTGKSKPASKPQFSGGVRVQEPSKPGGYYGPGGNPSGSGQDQAQQKPGMGPYQRFTPPPAPAAPPPAPSGRDTSAPVDPNGAGGKGTSMSYAGFMQDIGTPQKIEVRDTFSSENLPGTASYGASFALNSGENQRSFSADAAIAQAVDGRIVPKVTLNAQNLGTMASMAENERQLTPGEGSFSSNPGKLGVMDTSVPKSEGSSEADNLARRAAFLDADNSQQGLRAVEGLQGMMTQGGKNFVRDSSAEDGVREIDQDEYRARRRGGIIPAAKGKAGARLAQSETAASEAPQNVENPAVIGEDGKTEIIDNTTALQGVQSRFTVPTNEIPKNLTGAAGQEYFRKLDAGKLTR